MYLHYDWLHAHIGRRDIAVVLLFVIVFWDIISTSLSFDLVLIANSPKIEIDDRTARRLLTGGEIITRIFQRQRKHFLTYKLLPHGSVVWS